MRIYVASSWRNVYQPEVVSLLERADHQVYDFRNPPYKAGFKWKDIDKEWESWSINDYVHKLNSHPDAAFGFLADFRAMRWADACVLVMPCGRSAHLELGWMSGAGKRTVIYIPEPAEPELMYLLADKICTSMGDVIAELSNA